MRKNVFCESCTYEYNMCVEITYIIQYYILIDKFNTKSKFNINFQFKLFIKQKILT